MAFIILSSLCVRSIINPLSISNQLFVIQYPIPTLHPISRSVANAGMPVVYQKVKEALRTVRLLSKPEEMDENLRADLLSVQVLPEESLRIPAGPVVFWKETLGGYTALESSFDPVSMLLNAGWLPQEISLITILRDPIVPYSKY